MHQHDFSPEPRLKAATIGRGLRYCSVRRGFAQLTRPHSFLPGPTFNSLLPCAAACAFPKTWLHRFATGSTFNSSDIAINSASAAGEDTDEEGDFEGRYLSKAERKRLRKQQRSEAA